EAHASPRTPARTQKHSCWASLTVDEDMPQNKMKQHSKNSAAEWNHAIQRNRWRLQLSAVLERFSDAKRLQRPLISLDFERPSLPSGVASIGPHRGAQAGTGTDCEPRSGSSEYRRAPGAPGGGAGVAVAASGAPFLTLPMFPPGSLALSSAGGGARRGNEILAAPDRVGGLLGVR